MENPQKRSVVLGLLGAGATLGVLLPYSRAQEREADEIGLYLMSKAGFDPRASVQLWQQMRKEGGQQPPEFLSTHPSYETRIDRLQQSMDQARSLYREAREQARTPRCPEPPPAQQKR